MENTDKKVTEQETNLAISDKNAIIAKNLDALVILGQDAMKIKESFLQTFALGESMAKLREALTPQIMRSIMSLKGTKLGFKTDESSRGMGYDVDVVRDCLIEATLYGVRPTGNQFNIIAGGTYITKEGFTYLLRNLPDLCNFKMLISPAVVSEASTSGISRDGKQYQKIEREGRTKVLLSWVYIGVQGEQELEFVIKVQNGMGQDAIAGKAERKAKAWLYSHLTGLNVPEGENEEQLREPRTVSPSRSVFERKEVVEPVVMSDDVEEDKQEPLKHVIPDYIPGLEEEISESKQAVFDKCREDGISTDSLNMLINKQSRGKYEDFLSCPDSTATQILASWKMFAQKLKELQA